MNEDHLDYEYFEDGLNELCNVGGLDWNEEEDENSNNGDDGSGSGSDSDSQNDDDIDNGGGGSNIDERNNCDYLYHHFKRRRH